jgi:hypothetical protein
VDYFHLFYDGAVYRRTPFNLLTIPAIVMVYYYKRYKTTTKGVIWAFLIACLITGIVQKAVIQYTIGGAGMFDIFTVNNLGLPFFSGFIIFFLLLAAAIWYGVKAARKNNWSFLRLGLWSVAFMLIGYSTYITTMIRSNADPAVDMYNVDNPISLVGYLGREQYGDFHCFTVRNLLPSQLIIRKPQPNTSKQMAIILKMVKMDIMYTSLKK